MVSTINILEGDCREVLKTLPANSIDLIVTDPPYNLASITKRFGKDGSAPAALGVYARSSRGFMGKAWDSDVAFYPDVWIECLRVLKPGGHMVAFGGTRTYHRLVCAIEDAGFEIRDQLCWLYATGFPKSHNVSKMIDKRAGVDREVISAGKPVKRMIPGYDQNQDGWIKDNGREFVPTQTEPATDAAKQWDGWGSALKPAHEPVVLARKPLEGTLAENVLKWGTGSLNIDACRVPAEKLTGYSGRPRGGDTVTGGASVGGVPGGFNMKTILAQPVDGRWPANLVHDGSPEVLAGFPVVGSRGNVNPAKAGGGMYGHRPCLNEFGRDGVTGSAARFYFSAKASKADRNGSRHPTVKPISLIEWLIKLITPPGGTVLDPFAGSGTTGEAARLNGFGVVLVEMEAQYIQDIKNRMAEPKVWSGDDEPAKRPKGFF